MIVFIIALALFFILNTLGARKYIDKEDKEGSAFGSTIIALSLLGALFSSWGLKELTYIYYDFTNKYETAVVYNLLAPLEENKENPIYVKYYTKEDKNYYTFLIRESNGKTKLISNLMLPQESVKIYKLPSSEDNPDRKYLVKEEVLTIPNTFWVYAVGASGKEYHRGHYEIIIEDGIEEVAAP